MCTYLSKYNIDGDNLYYYIKIDVIPYSVAYFKYAILFLFVELLTIEDEELSLHFSVKNTYLS